MLSLTSDRLDYGEQLRAPTGYRLDLGISTTFSLDLEALVAASLALHLDQSLEGNLSGERLALLESLDQLQERLLVFYQKGNIKVPVSFNRLFTLLEPILAPSVALEGDLGAFASFHPKVWLLRFAPHDSGQPTLLRLVVLSRNLTFDRSWDIAVAIDGKTLKDGGNADPRLIDFLHSLSQSDEHAELIESMCNSLAAVDWHLPKDFDELMMLPGSAHSDTVKGSVPMDLNGTIDELLVVSPFVDAGPGSLLQDLATRTKGTKTLISRPDTLDAIGETTLAQWDVKTLSSLIVDGEERLHRSQPMPQELHAKLIVAKTGGEAIWHVGSANMTNAAFGRPKGAGLPRNRQFMLRLVGKNAKVGPTKLIEEWTSTGAFQSHTFKKSLSLPQETGQELRRLVYQLTSATWSIRTRETSIDHFSVELTVTPLPSLPRGYSVTAGLLCRPTMKELAATLTWDDVKLIDVSAFIPVEITSETKGVSQRFAVQAIFHTDLMDFRKRALFKECVNTADKLLRYLTLLLDSGASKAQWLRADGNGSSTDVFGLDGRGALYEQLLRAASRAPDRLARATRVFERMREERMELPPGLEELFSGFSAFAGR